MMNEHPFVREAVARGVSPERAVAFLAREDCGFFLKYVLGQQVARHHQEMLDLLCDRGVSKKMILCPRGFGKSTVITVGWVLWRILNEPNLRVLLVSRSAGTAGSFLFEMRQHIEGNAKIRAIWGRDLVGRPWNDEMFTLGSRTRILREPTVTALGASGAVISRHYDLIVADDVVTFETARTLGQRDKLIEWWGTALLPTLEPTGELVVVGTRYHPDDLYQHLMESGNYKVLRQAALWNRAAGRPAQPGDDDGDLESLWPGLWPVEVLLDKRREVGSARFQAQYQNDVEAMVGSLFDKSWFRSVAAVLGDRKLVTYVGIDLAISQKATADYFAWAVIQRDPVDGNVYVIGMGRDRLTFDQQVQRIVALNRAFRPRRIGIEDVAYQQALIQHLQGHSSIVPVRGVKRRGVDKITRAMMRLQPLAENGKLLFVGESEVFDTCWQELLSLHTGEGHDDLFDALDTAVEVSESSEPRVWLL